MPVDKRYMLDTNACIDLLVGRSRAAADRFEACKEGAIVTSAIVYAEIMIGAVARDSESAARRFFDMVPVLSFDDSCGDRYADLPFRRGNFDRLIAAHALSLGLTLVTNNERDFANIPGLAVENWTLPLSA